MLLHKPIARTKRNYNCDTEQLVFNSTLTVNRSTWLAELSWDSLCQPPTLCCLSSPPPSRLCRTNKRVQLALLIALIHTPFGQQRRPEVASNGNRNNNNKRKSRCGRGWARGLEIPCLGAAETEALVARICCSVQCTMAKRSAFSMHCTPTQPRPAHQPPTYSLCVCTAIILHWSFIVSATDCSWGSNGLSWSLGSGSVRIRLRLPRPALVSLSVSGVIVMPIFEGDDAAC